MLGWAGGAGGWCVDTGVGLGSYFNSGRSVRGRTLAGALEPGSTFLALSMAPGFLSSLDLGVALAWEALAGGWAGPF